MVGQWLQLQRSRQCRLECPQAGHGQSSVSSRCGHLPSQPGRVQWNEFRRLRWPHFSHIQARRRSAGGGGVWSRCTSSAALVASADDGLRTVALSGTATASAAPSEPSSPKEDEARAGWGFGMAIRFAFTGIRFASNLLVGCRIRPRDRDRSRGNALKTGGAKILCWMLPIMLHTHSCPRK